MKTKRIHIKVKPKAWVTLGLLAICVTYFSWPALAQSTRDIMNRLSRMEKEIDTLNRAVYKGEKPPPSSYSGDATLQAGAEVRMQQLEIELRDLTGRLEEQDYKIRQMQEALERALGDMDVRMQDMERGGSTSQTGGSGVGLTTRTYVRPTTTANDYPERMPARDGTYQWSSNKAGSGQLGTITPNREADTPASVYENAFSLLKNGQYDQAEKEFAVFLERYSDHVLAGNAKYWLGETYYVRRDYETAARTFAEAYQQYPEGTKAPDNLLKLGMSLSAMGNTADACTALAQVGKAFSTGAGPVLRRAEQEMVRLGC